jgi:tubulin polyglutamylase TTLL9
LARKDLLIKNLKRAKRTLAKKGRIEESEQYNFFPLTFSLPGMQPHLPLHLLSSNHVDAPVGEYLLFVEAFKKTPETNWIMKPVTTRRPPSP